MSQAEKPRASRRAAVLSQIKGPELFIGLVGAVGTNLRVIVELLTEELKKVAYHPHEVHLSSLLAGLPKFSHLAALKNGPEDERIDAHMAAGDEQRRTMNSGDALALLSVMAIRDHRRQTTGDENKPIQRSVYLLNSLKHPEEIRMLRRIYGGRFV